MNVYVLVGVITVLILLALPTAVSGHLRKLYKQYSSISANVSSDEIVEDILFDNGIYDVCIEPVSGILNDSYNSRTKVIRLSENYMYRNSLSQVAVSAHEAFHAVQYSKKRSATKLRQASCIVLLILLCIEAVFSVIEIMNGNFMVTLYCLLSLPFVLVLSRLVTLVVEFDASYKAVEYMQDRCIVKQSDMKYVKNLLAWAAVTYLLSAFISALSVLRIFSNN